MKIDYKEILKILIAVLTAIAGTLQTENDLYIVSPLRRRRVEKK